MSVHTKISTTTAAPLADPLDCFVQRSWARAYLASVGEITVQEAVDALQVHAEASGLVAEIGQDAVQAIIAKGFSEVGPAP